MGEIHKINETGGGATASLLMRFFIMVLVLNIAAVLVFLFKFSFDLFPYVEYAILGLSLLVYLPKSEAERLQFEGGKIIVTGKRFFFVSFKKSASYSKVKYKFRKPAESKVTMWWFLKRSYRIELYKEGRHWVDITGGPLGWSKIRIGDIAKTLISKGCYNWFEFNNRKRR